MIRRAHHIDFLVRDLDGAVKRFTRMLARPPRLREQLEHRGVALARFDLGNLWLILVQPIAEDSPVRAYLEEHGEGFFHLALLVDDLEAEGERLLGEGVRLVNEIPRPGVEGWRLLDPVPEDTCGAVLQWIEEPPQARRIRVIEVGPRDGLQMERDFVPTETKVEILRRLIEAGVREIEAVSFVHPKVIPQMRDAAQVLEQVHRLEGADEVRWSALVPNLKGADRALEVGVDEIRLVVCATETYNRRNVGLTIVESESLFAQIAEAAAAQGVDSTVIFGVALGCPLEGEVPPEWVAELADRFLARGAAAVGIADSYGLANPWQVRRALQTILPVLGDTPAWLHLHDTRGMAMANAVGALEEGITAFDTAFGGLGGTPILKGASGNIPTEDFLYLCREMGLETGIDLDSIRALSREMEAHLGRRLPSHVLQAGTGEELTALNR